MNDKYTNDKYTNEEKQPLRRSRESRMIAGVIGGLGEHYGIDPVKLRIVYVLISLFSAAFPGIIVYLILWFLIPEEDRRG